ncbi:MAG TPA: hypothetical protein VI753_06215 [Anaerolineales bacterium]|nr:hypothetical protein [Anaerolineales bacterium]
MTRLFSVAQFYHFAFMIVSIALLGFGASGTTLTIFPSLLKAKPGQRMSQLGMATGISILAAYLLTNWLPFDSFSIAWDRRQVLILVLHYIALATPFFFSGMALGFLLAASPQFAGTTYAVNLLGSAAGCVIALIAPASLGGEGMVTLSIAIAVLAALMSTLGLYQFRHPIVLGALVLLIFAFLDLGLRLTGKSPFPFMELRISPYKSLSYAMQYPGARVIYRQWNAFSRVDVVRSGGIHSLPGLSYRYLRPLPSLDGLLVDGDDLSPILQPSTDPAFVEYLPNAVAFHLRPQASVLILEPRGGLDVLIALTLNTRQVTAVEINPLIVGAVPIYNHPRVQVYVESDRSYLRSTQMQYDVIVFSLASSFHPVGSGAYTLAEDYRYTVESFNEALAHLTSDGLLVVTRWLQDPPSEDLRLFALAVMALENTGADPRAQIVAFRGYNTTTILLKNSAFALDELSSIRAFAAQRAFDLTYAPGLRPDETNLYNILPESKYYQTYASLLEAQPRRIFYDAYNYDVRPPTDDHPFFGHYFKWSQAPQVLAEFGKAWQPFGGAGYFVIVALLGLAILLANTLILLPAAMWKRANRNVVSASPFPFRNLVYFGLLGFAFLFVEIPLLQRFILYLGHPAYAVTTVLFSLLFFSGLGSQWSDRIPLRLSLATLVVLILSMPVLLPRLFAWTLGLPLTIRLGLTALFLSPVGFLMGIPFPAGIRLMKREPAAGPENEAQDGSIPWIWAVNGAASVVSSILAALLALTFGFNWVLRLGALCYVGAWLTAWSLAQPHAARRQNR